MGTYFYLEEVDLFKFIETVLLNIIIYLEFVISPSCQNVMSCHVNHLNFKILINHLNLLSILTTIIHLA
jgi:hypothetical protein